MQSFSDFLNFKLFISPYVLVACYYIGAIAVPIGSWFFVLWVRREYWVVSDAYESDRKSVV